MTHPPPPPTLCEVTYDQDCWNHHYPHLQGDLPPSLPPPPHLPPFRLVSSAKSHQSHHSHHSHHSYHSGRVGGGGGGGGGGGSGGYYSITNDPGPPPCTFPGGVSSAPTAPCSSLVDGMSVGGYVTASAAAAAATSGGGGGGGGGGSVPHSYYDYLKNYYWDHPSTGIPSTSPTLPARSGTSLTWYADSSDGGGALGPGGGRGGPGDRPLFSLPALSRTGYPGDDPWGSGGEDGGKRNISSAGKLKWVDALNAWVPEKQSAQRPPYINFINTPPRVERLIHTRESSQKRGKDEQSRKLPRKSYSSPLYDPETLRKSRTVRFEAPRTASSSPQPIVLPEQIDVPLAVWEDDTTVLEGESFEMVQAQEELQEQVVMVVVKEPTPPVDQVLEPPDIVNDPVTWPEVVEERVPTPEVVEIMPITPEVYIEPNDRGVKDVLVKREHLCHSTPDLVVPDTPTRTMCLDATLKPSLETVPEPPEEVEPEPVATSSPRQTVQSPSPRPAPVRTATPVEEPVAISSSSESLTPPPTPPPVMTRRTAIVDPDPPEEPEGEKTNLVGLMSRLSSLNRVKPKPKPKKERPPPEKTPRQPPKPKPVEKPPPPPPPKPVKQPKPPAPKPVKQPKPPKPKPEPKEKKIVPKPAPKPPPPVKEKKEKPKPVVPVVPVVPLVVEEEPVMKPVPLPISPPEEIIELPPAPVEKPPPTPPPPPPPAVVRAPVKKKEKLPPPPPRRRTPTPPPKPPTPVFEKKEREDWIFGSDEEEKKEEEKEKEEEPVVVELPTLPPSLPTPPSVASPRTAAGRGARNTMNTSLMALKTKPRWGQKQKDTSLMDAEERERLAEERRRRHAALMERYKYKKEKEREDGQNGGPNFEDLDDPDPSTLDSFLAKYCILNHSTTDKYRYTFDHMDEGEKGYLTEEETAYGLRAINPTLSTSERTYLFRVLEIAGHKMKLGTDFKLFSILAALSQRVSRLDEWARNMMAEMDYRNLEMKLFLCKTLWECNVDESTNTISLDQLVVELRAGGVSPQHEGEVCTKLADHRHLDFFDFLMYVPLFVMIHETVVTDPLSVSRIV